ncbi:MAG: hypothetical protein GYB53_09365 [Rhodobacteraceae bacterium]|nr:hypothetical protein [Paracoccaceae bacterium]MBR9819465.1 hypothetical protein [Paracoccaceae bacterium]
MVSRPGYHLAELTLGRLVAKTDDPRVGDVVAVLDRQAPLCETDAADPACGRTWLRERGLRQKHACGGGAA